MIWQTILAAILGYLAGSIPVGYLVGRAYGVDVRRHGSGRTGGTNVWRAAGLPAAVMTVVGDALKGVAVVLLARYLWHSQWAAAMAGAMAVLGHNWSLWLRFRGGAGGITGAATLASINWVAALIVIPMAALNIYVTRYASVATLTVGVGGFLTLLALWVWRPDLVSPAHVLYGVIMAAGIVWSLRPNLKRLKMGTEREITLW